MTIAEDSFEVEIERIRFKKDDGWGILVAKRAQTGKLVTMTGLFPGIVEGDYLSVRGAWDQSTKFGLQFKVTGFSTKTPSSIEGTTKWLIKRLPAVGRVRAAKLVDRFGETLWSIMRGRAAHRAGEDDGPFCADCGLDVDDVDEANETLCETWRKLAEIDGISLAMAQEIHEVYVQFEDERDLLAWLYDLGLTDRIVLLARERWGLSTRTKIEDNPYVLMHLERVGFELADRIALDRFKFDRLDLRRVDALLGFVITQHAFSEGHVYMPRGQLFAVAAGLGQVHQDALYEVSRSVGNLRELDILGTRCATTERLARAEEYAARRLLELVSVSVPVSVPKENKDDDSAEDSVSTGLLSAVPEEAVEVEEIHPLRFVREHAACGTADDSAEAGLGQVEAPCAEAIRAHHCHAVACYAPCKPEYLMCRRHWKMVPKDIQNEVYATYQEGQCDRLVSPSVAWHRAADKAIAYVAIHEKVLTQEQVECWMRRVENDYRRMEG